MSAVAQFNVLFQVAYMIRSFCLCVRFLCLIHDIPLKFTADPPPLAK